MFQMWEAYLWKVPTGLSKHFKQSFPFLKEKDATYIMIEKRFTKTHGCTSASYHEVILKLAAKRV